MLPSRGFFRNSRIHWLRTAEDFPEWQDDAWLKREQFPTFAEALRLVHRPIDPIDLSPDTLKKTLPVASAVMILALTEAVSIARAIAAKSGQRIDGNQEFIGVDLDNGGVYYNGRNSGRYCLYRTVDVFNRYTGYVEQRRVRRCGRGL